MANTDLETELSSERKQPQPRRLGQFRISREMIDPNNMGLILPFFGMVAVVRCELHFIGYFEYVALSPHFEPVEPGEAIPFYTVEITKLVNEDKSVAYTFAFKREVAP